MSLSSWRWMLAAPLHQALQAGERWTTLLPLRAIEPQSARLLNIDELEQLALDVGGAPSTARDDHGDARKARRFCGPHRQGLHVVAPPRKDGRHLRSMHCISLHPAHLT